MINMRIVREKTLEEIKQGYTKDKHGFYHCNFCDAVFEDGEIFPINGHFYRAEKAIQIHIRKEHGSVFTQLLQLDKKSSSLTDVQKKLLSLMEEGKSDKEIAELTNTSASTVRHQRFVFKEKARQAKMYLALYELTLEGQMVEFINESAANVAEHFNTNIEDEQKILEAMTESIEPLRLKAIPEKDRKKIIILKKICENLDSHKLYCEEEINQILQDVFDDVATLRRSLLEYGFLYRTQDCRFYSMDFAKIQSEETK